jgi:hypothetical protein
VQPVPIEYQNRPQPAGREINRGPHQETGLRNGGRIGPERITNASDYEIHSYCAHAAKNDCPLAPVVSIVGAVVVMFYYGRTTLNGLRARSCVSQGYFSGLWRRMSRGGDRWPSCSRATGGTRRTAVRRGQGTHRANSETVAAVPRRCTSDDGPRRR